MSPAKSKVPSSPPKKTPKSKTPDAETKPAASSKRKTAKAADTLAKTAAVADGLTTADGAAAGKPATVAAPKVSRPKTKTPAVESVPSSDDTQSKPAPTENVPASGDMQARQSPTSDNAVKPGAMAMESAPHVPDVKTPMSGGEGVSKGAELQPKSGVTGTPAVAGDTPSASQPAARAATDDAPPAVPSVPAAAPADKPMELPKGALIAFRKSGGLKFSSWEIVVYPDGRVTYDGGDTAKTSLTRAARRMSDAQVVKLRRTLENNFFGLKLPKTKPDPDGYVIEIAARVGGKNNHVELNAAGMPGALNSLVEQLTVLLPSDQ